MLVQCLVLEDKCTWGVHFLLCTSMVIGLTQPSLNQTSCTLPKADTVAHGYPTHLLMIAWCTSAQRVGCSVIDVTPDHRELNHNMSQLAACVCCLHAALCQGI